MMVSLEALGINAYNLLDNKGRSLKFGEGSRVRQTPEEGWRTYIGQNIEEITIKIKTIV